jgi:glycine/D-amino acid oxidase-like deaminating enzyme
MNPAPVAIVGQGLAGTLLAWELERAGRDFLIFDAGLAHATSRMAAGIVNPVTGRRVARTWRADELRPLAEGAYRSLEEALGVPVWREMRIRRRFRDEAERRFLAERQVREQLAPFVDAPDAEGFWIAGAAHVDLPAPLAAARERWRAAGRLREEAGEVDELRRRHELVVLCTGAAARRDPRLAHLPWAVAKGESLTLEISGLTPDVIVSCGHWLLPLAEGRAKVGATYAVGAHDPTPTTEAREELARAAAHLTDRPHAIRDQEAGLRLTLPDKRSVVGRCPAAPGVGVLTGLGSKGVLLAPWLARQWVKHLTTGASFDPAVDVARFG